MFLLLLFGLSVPFHVYANSSATRLDYQEHRLDMQARRQWLSNYGYCGELSMIEAGMYYGQYMSQYDSRAMATPSVDQTREDSQLLLAINDQKALQRMHLRSEFVQTKEGESYLLWIKRQILADHPVVIGVNSNAWIFGRLGLEKKMTNLPSVVEYEHIVPVHGVRSRHLQDPDHFYSDDVLIFDDLGVVGSQQIYEVTFGELLNLETKGVYYLDAGLKYAVAILGVDNRYELFHAGSKQLRMARLDSDLTTEDPAIVGNQRPLAKPMNFTLRILDLQPGQTYRIYQYSNWTSRSEDVGRDRVESLIQGPRHYDFVAQDRQQSFSIASSSDRMMFYRVYEVKK